MDNPIRSVFVAPSPELMMIIFHIPKPFEISSEKKEKTATDIDQKTQFQLSSAELFGKTLFPLMSSKKAAHFKWSLNQLFKLKALKTEISKSLSTRSSERSWNFHQQKCRGCSRVAHRVDLVEWEENNGSFCMKICFRNVFFYILATIIQETSASFECNNRTFH